MVPTVTIIYEYTREIETMKRSVLGLFTWLWISTQVHSESDKHYHKYSLKKYCIQKGNKIKRVYNHSYKMS